MRKIRLSRTDQPPVGGWFWIIPLRSEKDHRIEGESLDDLVGQVTLFCETNGYPTPSEDVFHAEFCRRNYGRGCYHPEDSALPDSTESNTSLSISSYGPLLWAGLHSFGCRFGASQFLSYLDHIYHSLDDQESGCDRCYEHYVKFVRKARPDRVKSAKHAAVWSWCLHDAVNRQKKDRGEKVRILTFVEASLRYSWPSVTSNEFNEIKEYLGI